MQLLYNDLIVCSLDVVVPLSQNMIFICVIFGGFSKGILCVVIAETSSWSTFHPQNCRM